MPENPDPNEEAHQRVTTSFFDESPVLVAFASLDGRMTSVGGPWTELLGWSEGELTERPFIEFVHPDDIGPTIAEMVGLNEGRRTVMFRNRYRTLRGTWVWLQWHARPTARGEICAVAVDVNDVVAREAELERRRRMFEVVTRYQQHALTEIAATKGLEEALSATVQMLGAASCEVSVIETTENGARHVRALASTGPGVLSGTGSHMPLIEGLDPISDRAPTVLEVVSSVARFGRPIITTWTDGRPERSDRELLVVPLERHRTTGFLVLTRREESFSVGDIEMLAPLLAAIAAAIARERTQANETRMTAEVTRLSSMLGTMLDRSDLTVIATDADGRIELMNAAAERTFGGRSAADQHWPIDRLLAAGGSRASLVATLIGLDANSTESEWTFSDRTGRTFALLVTASVIYAADGTVGGWVLIGRSVEDRDRADQERLERARLNAQVDLLQRRERQLAALTEATQYVVASHTHREALDVIDHALPAAFGPDAAHLARVQGTLRSDHAADPTALRPEDCWALRTGHAFRSEPGARVRCSHIEPDTTAVCAPLGDGSTWSGVLVLRIDRTDDPVDTAAATALLDDVTRQLSNALANLRLRRALEEAAFRDPLTGVGNRRAADEALATAIARANSPGEPFAVVMVDIDHFKAVNDAFGHKAGDALLARFADFLRRHVREDDCVARVGGEEFLLVLRDIPRSALDRTVEDLRVGVHGLAVGASSPCSASFGAIHVSAYTGSADDLVAAADELMYRSKEAGRDRALVADLTDVSVRARSAP